MAEILERLNAEMKRPWRRPTCSSASRTWGLIPLDPPPLAETDRYIKAETAKFRALLTAIGLAGSQ